MDHPLPQSKPHSHACGGGCHHGPAAQVTEEQIATLVCNFYTAAAQDSLLGPVFKKTISDWEGHLALVADFWSHALLDTKRYSSHPFPVHMQLPIEADHFDRWLELFLQAADTNLPPDAAKRAKARASHMAESFKVGMFPFVGADGKPSRKPAKRE